MSEVVVCCSDGLIVSRLLSSFIQTYFDVIKPFSKDFLPWMFRFMFHWQSIMISGIFWTIPEIKICEALPVNMSWICQRLNRLPLQRVTHPPTSLWTILIIAMVTMMDASQSLCSVAPIPGVIDQQVELICV